jgi:hypothetical protein
MSSKRKDATFFIFPESDWQRRYEALRASYVERMPDEVVAKHFGFTAAYIRLLRYYFRKGMTHFLVAEAEREGPKSRKPVPPDTRAKIVAWRAQQRSSLEIAELLFREGVSVSIRTIQRILVRDEQAKRSSDSLVLINQSEQCSADRARTAGNPIG